MAVNNNSYSTESNIIFGSTALQNIWWNAQTFQLPSISLSPPQVNTRAGALINLAGDTVDFGDLSIDLILDKEWRVFDELYAHFVKRLNVETGKFIKYGQFDLWVEFFDGEGNSQKKFWFYNCRMTSFGDLSLTTQGTEDDLNVLNVSFVFDYMDYSNSFYKERISEGTSDEIRS